MATADTASRSSFRYIWTIENFSELTCLDLMSPSFVIKSIGDSVWNIEIYMEYRNIETGGIYCRIHTNQEELSEGIDYEISFLAADGSQLVSTTRRNRVLASFVIDKEAVLERWAEFVPNNTLTVQLRMWRKDREIPTDVCYARTRIQRYKGSFIWDVGEFSALTSSSETNFRSLASDERRVYPLKSFIKDGPFNAFLILYNRKNSYFDIIKVGFLILKCRNYTFSCELSVLDANGKVIRSKVESGQKDDDWAILNFGCLISKGDLTANKDSFLPNDTLVLRCSFEVGTGVTLNQIEYFTPNVSSVIEEKGEILDFDDDCLEFEEYFHKG